MSVRAYRVNKIDFAEDNTFNLWHHESLMEFLEGEGFYETLNEGCGLTELPVEVLEQAVEKIKAGEIKDEEGSGDSDDYLIKQLKKDIAWGKKHNGGYVRYYCF